MELNHYTDVKDRFHESYYDGFINFLKRVSLMSSKEVEENLPEELKEISEDVGLIELVNGEPFLGEFEISGIPGMCKVAFSKASIENNSITETVREYIESSPGKISQRIFELFQKNYKGSFSALCGKERLFLTNKEYKLLGDHSKETISLINGRVCCVDPELFKYRFETYEKIYFRVIPEEIVLEKYVLNGCESSSQHCVKVDSEGTYCFE